MDMNNLAYVGISFALVFLFIYAVYDALNSGWWKCSACNFRTHSEEEALGHAAKHAMHKVVKES